MLLFEKLHSIAKKEHVVFEDHMKQLGLVLPKAISFSDDHRGYVINNDLMKNDKITKELLNVFNISLMSWCASICRDGWKLVSKDPIKVECGCYYGSIVDGWGRDLGKCPDCNGTRFKMVHKEYKIHQ